MTIVILGVGNRFRGDDAIGSIITEEILQSSASGGFLQNDKKYVCHSERSEESTKVIIYDTETTPENYIDKVVEAEPDWVIFLDACNFGGKPGEFKLFHDDEIKEISYGLLSTHTLPLTLTIELIKKQLNCRISLFGIQPKSLAMGQELSPELSEAKDKIIQFIKKLITE